MMAQAKDSTADAGLASSTHDHHHNSMLTKSGHLDERAHILEIGLFSPKFARDTSKRDSQQQADIYRMITQADTDGDGWLTVREFYGALIKFRNQEISYRRLKRAFIVGAFFVLLQTVLILFLTMAAIVIIKDTHVSKKTGPNGVEVVAMTDSDGTNIIQTAVALVQLPLYVAPVLSQADRSAIKKLDISWYDDVRETIVEESAAVLAVSRFSNTSAEILFNYGPPRRAVLINDGSAFLLDGTRQHPICAASASCSSFTVDGAQKASDYIAAADAARECPLALPSRPLSSSFSPLLFVSCLERSLSPAHLDLSAGHAAAVASAGTTATSRQLSEANPACDAVTTAHASPIGYELAHELKICTGNLWLGEGYSADECNLLVASGGSCNTGWFNFHPNRGKCGCTTRLDRDCSDPSYQNDHSVVSIYRIIYGDANVLANPGAEDGTAQWTASDSSGQAGVSSDAYEGAQAFELQGPGSPRIYQEAAFDPPVPKVKLTAWVKLAGVTTGRLRLAPSFEDGTTGGFSSIYVQPDGSTQGNWKFVEFLLESVTQISLVEVRIQFDDESTSGDQLLVDAITLSAAAAPCVAHLAQELHVSTSGVDASACGSKSTPYATLQFAASQAAAGDTVYVHGGVYNGSQTITASGTAGSPILLRRWGQDRVTFRNFPGRPALDVLNSHHLVIDGFEIDGEAYLLPFLETVT
ncbi:hypothetical protein AB1Y20_002620 [Prymnesium parvum]|uniref:Probable pectate lyase C n=1 Tax=Prymnesium parvum TaxID=97485 RepID=A0AB34J931_PRYPA